MGFPSVFCPTCENFLTPGSQVCGEECTAGQGMLPPTATVGRVQWSQDLPGNKKAGAGVCWGDLVVFSHGNPGGGTGGVRAIHRKDGLLAWDFDTPHPVDGALICDQDYLYLATTGFIGSGAELYCLDKQGKLAWKKSRALPAGAHTTPVLLEARILLGLDNGSVLGFDSRSGEPIAQQTVNLPRGKIWLAKIDEHSLVALAGKEGLVTMLASQDLSTTWPEPLRAGGDITGGPLVHDKKIYFGVAGGKLACVSIRPRALTFLAENLKEVKAAPVVSQGCLWFGARDGCLHMINLARNEHWVSESFGHSIIVSPAVHDGFVAVCVNEVGVCLFSSHSRKLFWRHSVEGVSLFTAPFIREHVLYFGTDQGKVLALPFEHDNHQAAAEHYRQSGDLHRAGLYYALSARAEKKIENRDHYFHQAEDCWNENGGSQWAGRMWEGLGKPEKAAEAYYRAGEFQRTVDKLQAAEYYYRASRIFWRLGNSTRQEECEEQAARLAQWPRLRLEPRLNPRMTQGDRGTVVMRISNIGYSSAADLKLSLAGGVAEMITWEMVDPLGKDAWYDISLSITQTRLKDLLSVEAEYSCEPARRIPFLVNYNLAIEAEESPIQIETGDIVMGKIEVKNLNGRKVKIKTGDLVSTEILLGDSPVKQAEPARPPAQPEPLKCDTLQVVRVEEVMGDSYSVPALHWALFLADERPIDTPLPPGRYTRMDYDLLQPAGGSHVPGAHLPAWKALVVRSGTFRLAYNLGPFRTSERVEVQVACGLTLELGSSRPYALWGATLGQKERLDNQELAEWLKGEVWGTLQTWLAGKSETELQVSFAQRERVMLGLLEELRPTCERHGFSLIEPLYYLNFFIPGRQRLDEKVEQAYWQQAEEQVEEKAKEDCKSCAESRAQKLSFCLECGKKLTV